MHDFLFRGLIKGRYYQVSQCLSSKQEKMKKWHQGCSTCLRKRLTTYFFETLQESKFEYLNQRLNRLHEESMTAWNESRAALLDANSKLDRLLAAAMLDEEAKVGTCVGAAGRADQQDLQDRKRLKERLKEAAAALPGPAAHDGGKANGGGAAASVLESVFGIRKGDLRAGKERSRCAIYVLPPTTYCSKGWWFLIYLFIYPTKYLSIDHFSFAYPPCLNPRIVRSIVGCLPKSLLLLPF
jgi:hypothetical protein